METTNNNNISKSLRMVRAAGEYLSSIPERVFDSIFAEAAAEVKLRLSKQVKVDIKSVTDKITNEIFKIRLHQSSYGEQLQDFSPELANEIADEVAIALNDILIYENRKIFFTIRN